MSWWDFSTFAKKPVISFEVKALYSPPTLSNVSAIFKVFCLFLVPLKNICSKKWDMPLMLFASYLDPVPTNIKKVTLLAFFMGTEITLSPFLSVVFLYKFIF